MCLSVSYWWSAKKLQLKSGAQLNNMLVCICVAGWCKAEPEAPSGAADYSTDEFPGPSDTLTAGAVSGAGVQSGWLSHVQPHRGPLQWHYPQQGWLAQLPAYTTVSVVNLYPTHMHHAHPPPALQMGFCLILCQCAYLFLPIGQLWPVWVRFMSSWVDYSSTHLKRPWQTFWKPWRAQRYVWLHSSTWFTVQPNTKMWLYLTAKNKAFLWPIVWRPNWLFRLFWIITCTLFLVWP